MSYTRNCLAEASQIIKTLDTASIDHMAKLLVAVRERGGWLLFLALDVCEQLRQQIGRQQEAGRSQGFSMGGDFNGRNLQMVYHGRPEQI